MILQLLDSLKEWAKNRWAVDQSKRDAYEWDEVKPDEHEPISAPDATAWGEDGVPSRDGDDDRW